MEMAENNAVKNKRELTLERMRSKHPEVDFENEDVLFGRINDDYEDYDKQLADYQDRESKFSDMFTSDPRSATFMINWRNGEDPAVGLVRQFGTEIKEAIDDPDRQEEMAAAHKEFVERVAKEREYEDLYQKNLAESLSILESIQEANGMSDEEVDKTMEFLVTIIKDGVLGKFSAETIEMARKALTHDEDVSQAAHEGRVLGRNEKIEEKLRKKNTNDGTVALDGKNGSARKPMMPSFGVIDKFAEGENIWERGEEKRTKVR
jgi:ribosome-binding protein aMBF1 (putative translation factor)